MVSDDVLIYDIETRTFGKPDSSKDKLRIFGCYSYKTKKSYLLTKKEDIQKIIDGHKFLVGFNNVGTRLEPGYDNPILEREGFNMKYKIFIDLKNVIKDRAAVIKIKKGLLKDILMEYKLDYITRMLDLVDDETAKDEIDYKIFQKDVWTAEEKAKIAHYTRRDIEITKKLYEWVEDYFQVLKPFVKQEDIDKKKYLTDSIAKFTYKAICKAMKWEERYNTNISDEHEETISGGYVAYPAGEKFEGDIYCLDFNSLYKSIMVQCNLHGRKKDSLVDDGRPVWFGGGKWKVEGAYYSDVLSPVGQQLKDWYKDRVAFKKAGDRKEYTIKIILNTAYGVLDNIYYANVYDKIASGDCTRLGRQWTKYARKVFKENGYTVIYSDTDSIFILDPFNDKEKMLKIKDKIINDIKQTVPFNDEYFDMGIDDEIKYMYFFKGGNKDKDDAEFDEDDFINKSKGFMKKNYIYVTKDDRVVIKNLGIKKKSNTPLSKKIFWEYLVPKIKKGQIKFSKLFIKTLIEELLEKDIMLMALRKDVGQPEQYKSKTSLVYQIATKYGSGISFLIPNIRGVGVGKGKNYCTEEEFKERNLKIDDIDLSNVMKELDYFIKPPVIKDIFSFGK